MLTPALLGTAVCVTLPTPAAYSHVSFQNTLVNWFFLSPEFGVHPDVTKLICTMCVIGGSMGVFLKLPWPVWLGAPVGLLDGVARALPDFHSYSTAGTPESCMFENMCGPKVGVAKVLGQRERYL